MQLLQRVLSVDKSLLVGVYLADMPVAVIGPELAAVTVVVGIGRNVFRRQ